MNQTELVTKIVYESAQELLEDLAQYDDGSGDVDARPLVRVLWSLQEQIDELKAYIAQTKGVKHEPN